MQDDCSKTDDDDEYEVGNTGLILGLYFTQNLIVTNVFAIDKTTTNHNLRQFYAGEVE